MPSKLIPTFLKKIFIYTTLKYRTKHNPTRPYIQSATLTLYYQPCLSASSAFLVFATRATPRVVHLVLNLGMVGDIDIGT